MKEVTECLKEIFGDKFVKNTNFDRQLAVTIGAANEARRIKTESSAYRVQDVCPMSIGTSLYDSHIGRDKLKIIINRLEKIPCSKEFKVQTHEDRQDNVTFYIYQGESDVDICDKNLIAKFSIDNIPPMRKESVKFICKCNVDENCLVEISVEVYEPKGVIELDKEKASCSFYLQTSRIVEEARTKSCRCIYNEEEINKYLRNDHECHVN